MKERISELSMNAALAMIEAAAPKDEIEAALAVQMASVEVLRRLRNGGQQFVRVEQGPSAWRSAHTRAPVHAREKSLRIPGGHDNSSFLAGLEIANRRITSLPQDDLNALQHQIMNSSRAHQRQFGAALRRQVLEGIGSSGSRPAAQEADEGPPPVFG